MPVSIHLQKTFIKKRLYNCIYKTYLYLRYKTPFTKGYRNTLYKLLL